MKKEITPKGKLIPIGGKEARDNKDSSSPENKNQATFTNEGVLQEVLAEMKGTDSRIEIITTASEEPDDMAEIYMEAFGKLGCRQVNALKLDGRNVDSSRTLEALSLADGVFMTGGDQTRLTDKISGTKFFEALVRRYQEENFVIAGTSAGAMAMSAVMISEGPSTESLLKGIVQLQGGFKLLPNTIIDTHFMSRGRFSRLAEALLMQEGYTALGLCEDTGLVVSEGNILRTIGSGVVMVLQADQVTKTNFKEAKKMQPVYVEGMSMHILAKGASYSLSTREFIVEQSGNYR